jgi:predicted nuclease of restriction endonuclease-like (RecB) superfamily
MKRKPPTILADYAKLFAEVKERVLAAQYKALRAANTELVGLYWDIGRMIVARQQSASWGKAVVERLAEDLRAEFPGVQGFSVQNLWYMRQFYSEYAGREKLQPLVGEISWAKNLVIMARCKDALEREFYLRMTRKFGWSKNVLIHQVENQSYEKTLLGQTNFDKALTPAQRAHNRSGQPATVAADVRRRIRSATRRVHSSRRGPQSSDSATYQIFRRLPKNLQGQLPSPAQIARLLEVGG